MVMIEAMALGCPVISFARGTTPELIANGKTGFLVKDVEEMVHMIGRTDQIGPAVTRRHVQEHFPVQLMAEHYIRIYQQVIGASKP